MPTLKILNKSIVELSDILKILQEDLSLQESIQSTISKLATTFQSNGKLLLCGNGGSAAECQHMAAEYVATLNSNNKRKSLPAIALSTDTSFLTAWTNDFSVEDIFSRQLESLGNKGDILFAYSTSGNSKNIIKAINTAKDMGLHTVAFVGSGDGQASKIADITITVPSTSTPRIQEIDTLIGHCICAEVEHKLGISNRVDKT